MAAQLPSSSDDDQPLISDINITPFVDVVLVLLVIFIITAPILAKNTLLVKLPKAASSDVSAPSTVGVVVTKQGQILLDGKRLDESVFVATIEEKVKQNPELQGILTADEETMHKDFVHAIDLMKRAGLHKFGVQVEAEKKPSP
jgi:biopolymer transport protein ExbD